MDRLTEIELRLASIANDAKLDTADLDALEAEANALKNERKAIKDKAEKRKALVDSVINSASPVIATYQHTEQRTAERSVEDVLASKEYRSAFLKAMTGKPMTDTEKREFTLVPNTAGAVVPTQTANMIFDNMTKTAPMLNEIMLLRVPGNLRFAVQGTRNAAAAHGEGVGVVPAADTMLTVTLSGFEFMKVFRISATIQTMGIDAFESWIAKILGEDIAVLIDNEIINGGTVTGNIAAAQVWANGVNQITYVPGNLAYTDLTGLIGLLPAAFDANAKFLMRKSTFYTQVLSMTDANGKPIAVQDIALAGRYSILGYPVLIDDQVTANEAFLGDFRQVVGNLSSDIKVDRSMESGFLNNSIDFRGTAIFDCDIAQGTAIVKLNV